MWQYDGDVETMVGFKKVDLDILPTLDGMLIEPPGFRAPKSKPPLEEDRMLIYAAAGGIWVLTGGKSHRFALPADVTKLKNQGVPMLGR